MKNILIIRFSSFGDIVQTSVVTKKLKEKYKNSKITWLTKKEFSELVDLSPHVDEVISFNKRDGLTGLIKLSQNLRRRDFDLIYDAHSNLRSLILKLLVKPFNFKTKIITRSKERIKRFFLFKLGINYFDNPFRGMLSFLSPLKPLGISDENLIQHWNFDDKELNKKLISLFPKFCEPFVILAPSANWKMKRWPEDKWRQLIAKLNNIPIVLIGGPSDLFIGELIPEGVTNCINMAGKLSLKESCFLVSKANCVVSADSGMIHVADILGVRGLSLMGPTAFGFPTNRNIKTIEIDLPCRPCTKDGRGKCSRQIYQECLEKINPDQVKNEIVGCLS